MSAEVDQEAPRPLVRWLTPSLNVKPGRDPLGLQTITEDRIMPRLLPGVLSLSRRARYFSLYPFLLAEFERLRLSPSPRVLSRFFKLREYEYALAVKLCERPGCGRTAPGVNGSQSAGPQARRLLSPARRAKSGGRQPIGTP